MPYLSTDTEPAVTRKLCNVRILLTPENGGHVEGWIISQTEQWKFARCVAAAFQAQDGIEKAEGADERPSAQERGSSFRF